MIRWLIIIALISASASASAHEVGPFADWFNSRKQPDQPAVSCCGQADQFFAKSYEPADRPGIAFRVVVEAEPEAFEIDVPVGKVDWASVNPTGRGVIFVNQDRMMVYCFIPGTGT